MVMEIHKKNSTSEKRSQQNLILNINIDMLCSLDVVADDKHRFPAEIIELVNSLISEVRHRNKLIKVANSSHWLTVNEYIKSDHESDSG